MSPAAPLTIAMTYRLAVVMGAFVGGYAAANVAVHPSEFQYQPSMAQAATPGGRNPFGTLGTDPKPDQQQRETVAAQDTFGKLRDNYFGEMLNPLPSVRQFLPSAENLVSPTTPPLPLACEPLGSVASVLGRIAGRCLT